MERRARRPDPGPRGTRSRPRAGRPWRPRRGCRAPPRPPDLPDRSRSGPPAVRPWRLSATPSSTWRSPLAGVSATARRNAASASAPQPRRTAPVRDRRQLGSAGSSAIARAHPASSAHLPWRRSTPASATTVPRSSGRRRIAPAQRGLGLPAVAPGASSVRPRPARCAVRPRAAGGVAAAASARRRRCQSAYAQARRRGRRSAPEAGSSAVRARGVAPAALAAERGPGTRGSALNAGRSDAAANASAVPAARPCTISTPRSSWRRRCARPAAPQPQRGPRPRWPGPGGGASR